MADSIEKQRADEIVAFLDAYLNFGWSGQVPVNWHDEIDAHYATQHLNDRLLDLATRDWGSQPPTLADLNIASLIIRQRFIARQYNNHLDSLDEEARDGRPHRFVPYLEPEAVLVLAGRDLPGYQSRVRLIIVASLVMPTAYSALRTTEGEELLDQSVRAGRRHFPEITDVNFRSILVDLDPDGELQREIDESPEPEPILGIYDLVWNDLVREFSDFFNATGGLRPYSLGKNLHDSNIKPEVALGVLANLVNRASGGPAAVKLIAERVELIVLLSIREKVGERSFKRELSVYIGNLDSPVEGLTEFLCPTDQPGFNATSVLSSAISAVGLRTTTPRVVPR